MVVSVAFCIHERRTPDGVDADVPTFIETLDVNKNNTNIHATLPENLFSNIFFAPKK
jgi:hypothetical protein